MVRFILILGSLSLGLFSCATSSRRDFPERREAAPSPSLGSAPVCRSLTDAERQRVLEIANPRNFPGTNYHRGASERRGIERETDCSHFVHEVYRRAGLPYSFRTTAQLGNAQEFDLLPEKEARPGDLMLFRGHVGIVSEKGKIISALSRHRRRRKSSIAEIDRRFFKTFRGQRYVLRYRCSPPDASLNRTLASEKTKP